ncbi:MAG TPA: adenylyl-sulfate kinase [Nitrospirota bacterium]|nr:adenylyl-sulfate kinase [Nitrospirota bacterium]
MKNANIVWHQPSVTRLLRSRRFNHKSAVVWFTGLPSSGKSTVAHALEERLFHKGCRTFVLDGDNVRHGLCSDLGFSAEDRAENIRRIGEVAKLFIEAGVIVLTAFISPFRSDRERVRKLVGDGDFIEVFCDCPVEVCEQRDPKGHYRKAREGVIQHFTGVSAPYESPDACSVKLKTAVYSPEECADQIMRLLAEREIVSS